MKLKRMTSQEVAIGEEVFHVRPLAAMDSAQVFGDVTSVILPIAGVVAISSGDEEERKSSVELDMTLLELAEKACTARYTARWCALDGSAQHCRRRASGSVS